MNKLLTKSRSRKILFLFLCLKGGGYYDCYSRLLMMNKQMKRKIEINI